MNNRLIVPNNKIFEYKKDMLMKKYKSEYRKKLIYPIDNDNNMCYNSYGDRVENIVMTNSEVKFD